jgi:2'-5' RNA ligase
VVWIGVDPSAELAALHREVDDACAAVGLGREDRPFRPHLTIGRPRDRDRPDAAALARALAEVGFVAASRVASLHLMRSDLMPAGARHTPLDVFAFGGAAGGDAAGAPGGR